jgi:hypothetical protein
MYFQFVMKVQYKLNNELVKRLWIYLAKDFNTSAATTSPLIKLGGTPGPGTVN